MEKPTGTYQCVVSNKIYDGSELYKDPIALGNRWTCGDPMCGANVIMISKLPKKEYEAKQKESGLEREVK